jgi:hypothetical protein
MSSSPLLKWGRDSWMAIWGVAKRSSKLKFSHAIEHPRNRKREILPIFLRSFLNCAPFPEWYYPFIFIPQPVLFLIALLRSPLHLPINWRVQQWAPLNRQAYLWYNVLKHKYIFCYKYVDCLLNESRVRIIEIFYSIVSWKVNLR